VKVLAPGPLPVICAICEESGLIAVLNEELDWEKERSQLSPGLRIMALIMNCLTRGQPMYRLPEFFRDTDTENLFGEGIEAEDLNDHTLGRALDKLSDADPSTVQTACFWSSCRHIRQN
jgi:hypothetical protein